MWPSGVLTQSGLLSIFLVGNTVTVEDRRAVWKDGRVERWQVV